MATIKVRFIPTGQVGTVPEEEFDPTIYQRIDDQAVAPTPEVTAPTEPAGGGGMIRNIAEAFVRPVRKFGELIGEAGFQAKRFLTEPELRKSVLGGELTPEEAERLVGRKATRFIEPELLEDRGEIAEEAVRRTAGAAALALPVGVTGRAAAGLGALAGAGLAFSERNDVLLGAAFGATGGVIGRAIGQVLGALVPKLKGAGRALRRGVARPKVAPTPFGAVDETRIIDGLKKLGIKGSARSQWQKLPGVMKSLGSQIDDILTKSKKVFGLDDIKSNLISFSDDSIHFVPGDATYIKARERALARLRPSVGNKTTPKNLFDFKKSLGSRLSRAFSKLEKGNPLTVTESAEMALWEQVDNLIAGTEFGVPAVKDLTLQQSILFRAAPGLQTGAKATAKIPFAGTRISARPGQAITDIAGRAAERAGGFLEERGLEGLAVSAAPALQVGGRVLGAGGAAEPEVITEEEEAAGLGAELPQEGGQVSADGMWRWTGATWIPTQEHLQQMAVNDMQQTGGKNIAKITQLQKFLGEDEEAGGQSATALNVLGELRNVYGKVQAQGLTAQAPGFGRVAGGVRGGIAALTQASPEAGVYIDTKSGFMSLLSRGLGERGVLTDKDINRIDKAIPDFTDTPEKAAQSWQLIEDILLKAAKKEKEMTTLETLQPVEQGVAESLF